MFATSLFRPPWLPCLAFASYYLRRLVGWYSCHVSPLAYYLSPLDFFGPFTSFLPLITLMGLLSYSLGFLGPFITFLPFITLMGLLAIIPAMSTHQVYHFIHWASSANLLLLYLLLFPWAYHFIHWASLAHLLLFFIFYLLLLSWACWPSLLSSQPTGLVTPFSLIFLIVGLLLPLSLWSKVGINNLQFVFGLIVLPS